MGFLFDQGPYPLMLVIARILAGIAIDLLYQRLRPSSQRLSALRVFAFVVPLIVGGLYFLGGYLTAGIAWSIHLWAGSIVMTGVVGLLISYVAVPPHLADGITG